jgi:hypothetical protein
MMVRRLGWAVVLGVSLLLPQRPKVARLVAVETQRKLLPIITYRSHLKAIAPMGRGLRELRER